MLSLINPAWLIALDAILPVKLNWNSHFLPSFDPLHCTYLSPVQHPPNCLNFLIHTSSRRFCGVSSFHEIFISVWFELYTPNSSEQHPEFWWWGFTAILLSIIPNIRPLASLYCKISQILQLFFILKCNFIKNCSYKKWPDHRHSTCCTCISGLNRDIIII
jgi:hypothetical protein